MKAISVLYYLFIIIIIGCGSKSGEVDFDQISVQRSSTTKTVYSVGESVQLNSIMIRNEGTKTAEIDSIVLVLSKADSPEVVVKSLTLVQRLILEPGDNNFKPDVIVTSGLDADAYLLSLSMSRAGVSKESYFTFFRISDDLASLTYRIGEEMYNDIPVYKLFGGLSAEYTVQKAAATLSGGISHSWNVPGPGKGPEPILSTPDFLERSVNYTVDFYNNIIGETEPIETVVITTGIPSAAYLSSSLQAPALPIHFLVGAHTTREIQTILDYSQAFGMDAYATVGHDYSLSETQAVAWIKLLSLPPAYQKFIRDHQVKNVVFHGALGQGGESGARKLTDENGHYHPGSIYLMHFAGDDSEKYLGETIRDFDTTKLDPFIYIADWEAGVLTEQVQSISHGIRENVGVDGIYFFTTEDAIELWNAAAYLTLRLQQKNDIEPMGISLNPYLIGNPGYEFGAGYVPFLYWQGISPEYHIENRLEGMMKQAFLNYYPDLALKDLIYWVNSTNNFGGRDQGLAMASTLHEKGYSLLIENALEVSEVWDLSDGINAPSEMRAVEMGKNRIDFEPLTIEDLMIISTSFEGLIFEEIR